MPKIPGGYILIARKLSANGLSKRPPLDRAIWLWLLQEAKYKDTKDLKRGQLITTVEKIRTAMEYQIGFRTNKPSIKQVRLALHYYKTENMISTQKTAIGTLITIVKYTFYQDYKNYSSNA